MQRPPFFVLYVADQQASARFYRQVLGDEPVLDVPGMTEFSLGPGASLGLMPESGIARLLDHKVDPSRGAGVARAELYLRVEDPGVMYERAVAAGARPLSPMAARGWGDRVGYCQDPDGHVLAFASMPVDNS